MKNKQFALLWKFLKGSRGLTLEMASLWL